MSTVELDKRLERIEDRLYEIYEELAKAPKPPMKPVCDDIELSTLVIDVWLNDAEFILNHPSDLISTRERLAGIMQRIGSELLRLKWKHEAPHKLRECGECR